MVAYHFHSQLQVVGAIRQCKHFLGGPLVAHPKPSLILASLCMHLGSRSLLVAVLSLKTDCCRFMTDQVVRETFLDQLWEACRPLRGQRRIARSILSH